VLGFLGALPALGRLLQHYVPRNDVVVNGKYREGRLGDRAGWGRLVEWGMTAFAGASALERNEEWGIRNEQ